MIYPLLKSKINLLLNHQILTMSLKFRKMIIFSNILIVIWNIKKKVNRFLILLINHKNNIKVENMDRYIQDKMIK
jgi:hypothetical protein